MNAYYRSVCLCLCLFGASNQASASSAYIGIHSIDGLGRAYAGEVAVAETASATSKNPSLILSLDEGINVAVGAAMVISRFDARVDKHPFIQENEYRKDMEANNFGPNYIPLPGIHLAVNKGDWGLGFSVSSYQGGLLNYDDTEFGITELGDDTYALTANFQFDFAYKLADWLHVGAGVDYGYGKANVERAYGFLADNRFLNLLSPLIKVVAFLQENNYPYINGALPNLQSFDNPKNMLANFRGKTSAFGYHVGLNLIPTEDLNIGLTYRSRMKYKFEGRYYSDLPVLPKLYTYGTNSERIPASARVGQPAMAEVGINYKLTPKFDLHGGIFWQQWSDLQALKVMNERTNKPFVVKELKHEDNLRYSIGGGYQLHPRFKVRFGFSLDKSAVKEENASLTFPSSDRYWLSTGFNFLIDEKSSIDFGISYARNKTVRSKEVGLIVEALDNIKDDITVRELFELADIDVIKFRENIVPILNSFGVPVPNIPDAILDKRINSEDIMRPEIYKDLESDVSISAKLVFVGLQYNRKF